MKVDTLSSRLRSAVEVAWREQVQRLPSSKRALHALRPERQLAQRTERIKLLSDRLQRATRSRLGDAEDRLSHLAKLLRTLGPESAFERGFSITTTAAGKLVRSVDDARRAGRLRTRFKDGVIDSEVVDD